MIRRIQRQRTKGWRMPKGAVYVGRPSRWGNPFRGSGVEHDVAAFRYLVQARLDRRPQYLAPLRGHDLACWCPLEQPCHADVLLELANR